MAERRWRRLTGPGATLGIMRICIYSAIFGGFDDLKPPLPQSLDCDFLCFTDSSALPRGEGWQVIRSRRRPALHPRLRAKYFKLMSHLVFPHGRLAWRYAPLAASLDRRQRYDAVIWIDGSVQIKSPRFAEELVAHVGVSDWAMFVHPDRGCINDEAELSLTMAKYRGLPIRARIEAYRREGYPAKAGLSATGIIARRAASPKLATINAAWWVENCRWTYQDQLSLPVVLWRLGAGCDPIRHNLWSNDWFDCLPHRSELRGCATITGARCAGR